MSIHGRILPIRLFFALFSLLSISIFSSTGARAGDHDTTPTTDAEWLLCEGKCSVTLFSGLFLKTDISEVLGVEGKFTPPWRYKWGQSVNLEVAFAREVYRYEDMFRFELEVGAGQRFGVFHDQEFWVALYGRWTKFPWNDRVKTTIAVSTGLDYATTSPLWERSASGQSQGSHLMHYLSPEVTFADPANPNLELVFRLQHRSGGRHYWGNTTLFNSTGAGIQYGMVGIRYHF